MMSGSLAMMKSRQAWSMSRSLSNECTSAPLIGAQDLRVKMFLTQGVSLPCIVTQFAIWITGSSSGIGNCPFLPWHSMSKLRIRSGPTFDHCIHNE